MLIVVLVDLGSMGMGRGKEFEILEERGGGYSLVVLGGTLFVLIVLEIEGWRGERRRLETGICTHVATTTKRDASVMPPRPQGRQRRGAARTEEGGVLLTSF